MCILKKRAKKFCLRKYLHLKTYPLTAAASSIMFNEEKKRSVSACTESDVFVSFPSIAVLCSPGSNHQQVKSCLSDMLSQIQIQNVSHLFLSLLRFSKAWISSGALPLPLDSFPTFKKKSPEECPGCVYSSKLVQFNNRQKNTLRLHNTTVGAQRASKRSLAQSLSRLPHKLKS